MLLGTSDLGSLARGGREAERAGRRDSDGDGIGCDVWTALGDDAWAAMGRVALHYTGALRNGRDMGTDRYSKDYKFRPAASPVITEQLKDGRVRLRGAQPTVR